MSFVVGTKQARIERMLSVSSLRATWSRLTGFGPLEGCSLRSEGFVQLGWEANG